AEGLVMTAVGGSIAVVAHMGASSAGVAMSALASGYVLSRKDTYQASGEILDRALECIWNALTSARPEVSAHFVPFSPFMAEPEKLFAAFDKSEAISRFVDFVDPRKAWDVDHAKFVGQAHSVVKDLDLLIERRSAQWG